MGSITRTIWFVFVLGLAAAAARAQDELDPLKEGRVAVRAFLSADGVAPGGTVDLAVRFAIVKDFHIYTPDRKDTATKVEIVAPDGLVASAVRFEKPIIIDDPLIKGKRYPAYEKELLVASRISALGNLKPGSKLTLRVKIRYFPCGLKGCEQPADPTLPVEVVVRNEVNPANQEVFAKAKALGILGPALAASVSRPVETGKEPKKERKKKPKKKRKKNFFQKTIEKSLVLGLLLAFGLGVVTSLTPCVYPIVPITIAFFSAQSSQSKFGAFKMALTFVVGMVITYTTLGVVSTLAGKALGDMLGNPWIVGAFIALFLALALSLFGLYEIRLPSGLTTRLQVQGKQGYVGALLMGMVLGLVAAPCVGPFLAFILAVISTTGDVALGAASLASFGFGMGMLFLVLAVSSLSLPKSGVWLTKMKQFFGFMMVGVAVYFLSYIRQVSAETIAVLMGIVAISTGTFLGAFTPTAREDGLGRVLAKSFGLIGVLAGAYMMLSTFVQNGLITPPLSLGKGNGTGTQAAKFAFVKDFDEGVRLARKQGKPLFVDFWAHW